MLRARRLDLQAKISLVLAAVILPTFLIVTLAENQLTRPILEDEMRQIGVNAGKTLATEIASQRWLATPNPTIHIEERIQELLYTQPNIIRLDVIVPDPVTGVPRVIGSSVEENGDRPSPFPFVETLTTERLSAVSDEEVNAWRINVPIESRARDAKDPTKPRRILGTVHLLVSLNLVTRVVRTLGNVTGGAAAFSVVTLIIVLSYFLRKTIANDRKLRQAESQNQALSARLHEAQRQVMNTEKLAVMGQLTASFAHEIGTPLNAIGGHLQLLREELPPAPPMQERLDIINGQVQKIETIVKGFLQNTAKPNSQRQLVDVNQLADRIISIVSPQLESDRIEVRRRFDRGLGPVRVVPLDLEQIILNLVNNSLDGLRTKVRSGGRALLEISTDLQREREGTREWAVLSVYDTGEGIAKTDLPNVQKPFFTTKSPGEGTGLGLTICQQLARKYGADLEIDSRQGAWTRVTLKIPYPAEASQWPA